MSLKTQSKILRVLQEQKFHRVGGSRTLSVNVRVIAASNKGLEEEIERGSFREDLYYRLNVIPIKVPALRQRCEDIPLLVDIFLAESAKQNQTTGKKLNPKALDLLCSYPWPGNVRELKNLLERLTIMVKKDIIEDTDLPDSYHPGGVKHPELLEPQFLLMDDFKEAKKAFEKEFIQKKLFLNNNNITKTAKTIGVGRSYLHKKIKKLK